MKCIMFWFMTRGLHHDESRGFGKIIIMINDVLIDINVI